MKITNPSSGPLHADLADLLVRLRGERGFVPEAYVAAKVELLNEYYRAHNLRAAVVGTSGGIDSAVVLSLVALAAAQPGSFIERIVPVLMPVHDVGATNQDLATSRARELVEHLGLAPAVMDLTGAFEAARTTVESALGIEGDAWARGQLVSYQRTPALYYATSVLLSHGLPALVCGTTNRDEGAYLGYFGKASDGMVDVQVISDVHKSEVYALARHLGVPASVLDAPPSGDMYDGRLDEEVFGVPYDFVELHHLLATSPLSVDDLDPEVREHYHDLAANVENMHRYNAHKYLGRSPAVHLDVLDAHLPNGWNYSTWSAS